MNFTCENCHGVCCIAPPMLKNIKEVKKAKKLGVEIVATEAEKGRYMLAIAKKNDLCPFYIVETGKCGIYDDRFEACKNYRCKWLDEDKKTALNDIKNLRFEVLNQKSKGEPYTHSESTIKHIICSKATIMPEKQTCNILSVIDEVVNDSVTISINGNSYTYDYIEKKDGDVFYSNDTYQETTIIPKDKTREKIGAVVISYDGMVLHDCELR